MTQVASRMISRRAWLWAMLSVVLVVVLGLLYRALGPAGEVTSQEAARLGDLLNIKPGMTVAEVGAGDGSLSIEIATRLGPSGRLFSTELETERLTDIREAVKNAGLHNVRIVEAGEKQTNLPDRCCDAIFMRAVYHHLTDPKAINRSLFQALRPAGLLAIIDFEPSWLSRWWGRPTGTPENRDGHGIRQELLIKELVASGFTIVRRMDDWPRDFYCVLFRKDDAARIR